jgi:uncharacterized protein YbcI
VGSRFPLRELPKQVRTPLIEAARPALESLLPEITGIPAICLHHDISTVTGQQVVLFTLRAAPRFRRTRFRETRKK